MDRNGNGDNGNTRRQRTTRMTVSFSLSDHSSRGPASYQGTPDRRKSTGTEGNSSNTPPVGRVVDLPLTGNQFSAESSPIQGS